MDYRQCRAARALLGWNGRELATRAKVDVTTLSRFEKGGNAYKATVDDLQAALEAAGVVFIAPTETSPPVGPGVRLRAD